MGVLAANSRTVFQANRLKTDIIIARRKEIIAIFNFGFQFSFSQEFRFFFYRTKSLMLIYRCSRNEMDFFFSKSRRSTAKFHCSLLETLNIAKIFIIFNRIEKVGGI